MADPLRLAARLGDIEQDVRGRLDTLWDDDVVARIWARDHTVWREDPAEIANRLGWLDAPERSRADVEELRGFAREVAADGMTHAVLLGMGGSSLAPEVLRRTFGVREGSLDLRVLDSTHPEAIVALERDVPLDRTLFVVSSKSGTTIETRSHLAYFHDRVGDGSRFVAITDPGTELEELAAELEFRRIFRAPPDVGGRYSALTVFGLLPAALVGVDLDALLDGGAEAARACQGAAVTGENPGAFMGAVMGEAAVRGRDKLILAFPGTAAPLAPWVEQLVAESTGKDGMGIVPVVDEPSGTGPLDDERLLLAVGETPVLEPWVTMDGDGARWLGTAIFALEFATAVAGHIMGIHPFDQPDVKAAKDGTADLLASGEIPEEPPDDLDALLATVGPRDYVAVQAFCPPGEKTWTMLQEARSRIRDRVGAATTLGYGPRYLHSTGQLHKGGPNTGVFVQVFDEPGDDRDVPGAPYTFGRLIAAQAAGDLGALRERGRRVARVPREALLAWGG